MFLPSVIKKSVSKYLESRGFHIKTLISSFPQKNQTAGRHKATIPSASRLMARSWDGAAGACHSMPCPLLDGEQGRWRAPSSRTIKDLKKNKSRRWNHVWGPSERGGVLGNGAGHVPTKPVLLPTPLSDRRVFMYLSISQHFQEARHCTPWNLR